MAKLKVKGDDKTITVRVPIAIRKRGGRKLVIAPDGRPAEAPVAGGRVDNALVKAFARAFRWQELLENGTYATIAEIAESESINESYVSRIYRLTLLAPGIVEMVIGGQHHPDLDLASLLGPLTPCWGEQKKKLRVP